MLGPVRPASAGAFFNDSHGVLYGIGCYESFAGDEIRWPDERDINSRSSTLLRSYEHVLRDGI